MSTSSKPCAERPLVGLALQEDLTRSSQTFRAFADHSPDLVFVYTGQARVEYANPHLLEVLGFDANELLGKSCFEAFVHPDDRETIERYRSASDATRPPRTPRVRWRRKDGTEIVVEASPARLDLDGQPATLVYARDVTEDVSREVEHARTQALLRASEERYRLLFEQCPVSMMLFDPLSFQILAVNEATVRLYGYTQEEFLTLKMGDIKVDEEMADFIHEMSAVRAGERAVGPSTTPFRARRKHRRKDGRALDLEITAHPAVIDGKLVQIAIGVDMTATFRLEERVRHAQRMDAIGQLAGGIAHDFNNLLSVILADAEWLREELVQEDPLHEAAIEIEQVAIHAAGLTRQLLAFSRQQVLEPRTLALGTLVADLERMLRRIIGEDFDLQVRVDEEVGAVRADPGLLEQVVVNLVVNARDAMPRGGRLVIEVRNVWVDEAEVLRLGQGRVGAYVVLTVQDAGAGMDSATLARIFEPFFTTKAVGKGTGLGLSIVFGIVQQSQGFLDVTSQPSHGSTFRVYLPRLEAPVDVEPSSSPRVRASGRGERVLVVEDDAGVRRIARRVLEANGYEVDTATCGPEALERLSASQGGVALLLTDVVMPVLDGVTFAAVVRERYPQLPVLYMTGHASHEAMKGIDRAHAALLRKPFSSRALESAVRAAIDGVEPRGPLTPAPGSSPTT